MKFKGNGLVWDKERNKPLCKFINGEFETDDMRTIEVLASLNYESDGNSNDLRDDEVTDQKFADARADGEEISIDFENMTIVKLRDYCKDHDFEGYTNLNKQELIAFIIETEA